MLLWKQENEFYVNYKIKVKSKKVAKEQVWITVLIMCKTVDFQWFENNVHKVIHNAVSGGFWLKKSTSVG